MVKVFYFGPYFSFWKQLQIQMSLEAEVIIFVDGADENDAKSWEYLTHYL